MKHILHKWVVPAFWWSFLGVIIFSFTWDEYLVMRAEWWELIKKYPIPSIFALFTFGVCFVMICSYDEYE